METTDLLYPSILLLSFLSFLFYLIRNLTSWKNKKGSESDSASASKIGLAGMVKNGHRFLDWITEQMIASPTNTVLTSSGIITANPAHVEHILKTNFDNYPKGESSTGTLADLLGRGIFNTDGDHWKIQRKIASLEFTTKTIRTFIMDNIRREVAVRLLPLLSAAASAGEIVNLQDILDRFAFDNVCKVAFDVDPARLAGDTEDGGRFARAFAPAADISIKRFQLPRVVWKVSRMLNIGTERQLKKELAVVNEFAMKVVRERKERKEGGDDLLSRFIAEGDFSDDFLRDIVLNFVLAGRDTTSTAMAWFFWLVSTRPAVQEKILEEVRSVRSRHGSTWGSGAFTVDEVRDMCYLQAAVSEALRLYPPISLDVRTCVERDVLPDGTVVGKGWTVMYSAYAMGRMEGIWGEDCREYRPDRWMEKGEFRPVSPCRFPVFHVGPRTCLGKEMAYTQMKAVVASVMERFELEVAEEGEREHELNLVLRMKGGLPVRVRERKQR